MADSESGRWLSNRVVLRLEAHRKFILVLNLHALDLVLSLSRVVLLYGCVLIWLVTSKLDLVNGNLSRWDGGEESRSCLSLYSGRGLFSLLARV